MKNKIKNILTNKLFKDSFVYVISDVINKGIPFLLLPVLTHYLTPEDYGILATFNSLVAVLAIFIGLSIQGAVSVNYYKYSKSELANYIGNVLYILFSTFLLSIFFITLFNHYLQDKLGLEYIWMIAATGLALSLFLVLINLSLWLVEQKPKLYGSYQIFETALKLGLSLLFIIVFSMTWKGRVLGMLIGGGVSAFLSLIILYRRGYLHFAYNKKYIKDALHFGVPLVPHSLSFWLRSGAVIFILSYLVGKKNTGLYNVGNMMVIPLSVLTVAFNKAWAPYLYRKLSKNISILEKKKIVKFTYMYNIAVLLLAYVLYLIAPFIIEWFLDPKFKDSAIYIKYLAFALAFQGMYFMVVNYIFYEKKTKYLAYITFITSIVNVMLAYVLIKKNGAIGAAQAFLITSILNYILVWFYSNKVYKMPWNFINS